MSSPTPFQLLPRLTDEEFTALRDDIRENGIRVPIDVDEDGLILDGHHRSWVAAELGIEVPRRIVTGLDEQGKRNHARAVNAIRRHLTRDQRREQVGQMRAEGQSVRMIAGVLGIPKSTVSDDIAELSETGQLEAPESVKGADGKSRPATFKRTEKSSIEESYEVDAATGELIEDEPAPFRAAAKEPRRGSLIEDARNAGWQLRKAVERLERLKADDRFTKNKAEILAALQPHLDFANEVFADL